MIATERPPNGRGYAEVRPNLEAILDAQIAYMRGAGGPALNGIAGPSSGTLGKEAFGPMDVAPAGYAAIGFRFDGAIRAAYSFHTQGHSHTFLCNQASGPGSGAGPGYQLYATGQSDVDGDGKQAVTLACEHGVGTSYTHHEAGRIGQISPSTSPLNGNY